MHDLNIASAIARERRAAGITQDELAAHLGVTKAAVSKWELGQSLPDVALLPRLAAYFRLTLDELFDYRPQLTKEEVQEAYLELFDLHFSDPAGAVERLEDLVRDYYGCWHLVFQMGLLCLQFSTFDPEGKEDLMRRAGQLFARVEEHADDVELVRAARLMRGALMNLEGDLDGAIELFKGMMPEQPLSVEMILADLYRQKGDLDECLRLHQTSLYWGEANVMNSIASQLPLYADDRAHLDALLRAGEGVLQGFGGEGANALQAASFFGGAATACLKAGDEERARAYLERFADVLGGLDLERVVAGARTVLFDRMPELSSRGREDVRAASAQLGAVDLKAQAALSVTADDAWEAYADDPRFKPLLERLAAPGSAPSHCL